MTGHVSAQGVVFVYGALRSGTTVFRLMLDAHPQIANPGEKDFLFDFLHPDATHPTGWRYDLDALRLNRIFQASSLQIPPGLTGLDLLDSFLNELRARDTGRALSINLHRHVDRVLAIMPDVRLLHMLRDPRDVARSSIAMGWAGSLYYGVGHWIETETDWDKALATPHRASVMALRYEDLFEDTEARLREVCDFFDVPFDPAMLRYHETSTYDAPDPTLIAQWRRKSKPADVALLESRAGDLMQARGYPPEMPHTRPDVLTRIRLFVANKRYLWTFGMRRFGVLTYWGEKLSRRLRLTGLHRRLRQRMNHVVRQGLK